MLIDEADNDNILEFLGEFSDTLADIRSKLVTRAETVNASPSDADGFDVADWIIDHLEQDMGKFFRSCVLVADAILYGISEARGVVSINDIVELYDGELTQGISEGKLEDDAEMWTKEIKQLCDRATALDWEVF